MVQMKKYNEIKHKLLRLFLRIYTNPRPKKQPVLGRNTVVPSRTSIVISTFEKRYFQFALPLLNSIRSTTNIPVTIVVNGNFDTPRDSDSYREFVIASQAHANVSLVTFNSFRGWSSLLNAGILHGDSEISIVLNDDIFLNPTGFATELEAIIQKVNLENLVLINNSWSHFAINRMCLDTVGFFDENFLGIGQEDGDYAFRFKTIFGKDVPSIKVTSMLNFVDTSRDSAIAITNGKYSLFNSVYLKFKVGSPRTPYEQDSLNKSEGSLMSIYAWRNALYKCLSWSDEDAISGEIEKNLERRNQSNRGISE